MRKIARHVVAPDTQCAKDALARKCVRVLVVESDEIHRAGLFQTLAGNGLDVVLAAGGREAVRRLKSQSFHLVISAVTLSDMDGLELMQSMRDEGCDVPVVMVSRSVSKMDEIYLKAAGLGGAARIHMQPLASQAFLESVAELLADGAAAHAGFDYLTDLLDVDCRH